MTASTAVGILREDRRPLAADALEQRLAGRHPVLDHFVEPRTELAARQGLQHGRIDGDGERLIEGADQVLPERMVDADFSADRRVDLRQQRRRHVDQRDAAQIRGRGEPGHVADHAAAEREQRRGAIGVGANQRLVDARDILQVLEALAVGDEDRLAEAGFRQPRSMQPPDERARDDEPPRRRLDVVEEARQPVEQAVFERDGVAARGRVDVDANHVCVRPVGPCAR